MSPFTEPWCHLHSFGTPPVVSTSGTASGPVYNTGGIWSHWVNVMILCYLLWGLKKKKERKKKHTEHGWSLSVRWADVNRSQVLEYKAHSAPEGQWKWDPKVPQFHMLIFNSCCLRKPFFFFFSPVNADACFCPISCEVFKKKDRCLVWSLGLALSLCCRELTFSDVSTNIFLA